MRALLELIEEGDAARNGRVLFLKRPDKCEVCSSAAAVLEPCGLRFRLDGIPLEPSEALHEHTLWAAAAGLHKRLGTSPIELRKSKHARIQVDRASGLGHCCKYLCPPCRSAKHACISNFESPVERVARSNTSSSSSGAGAGGGGGME